MNSAIPEKVSEETPSALDSALIAKKETNAQRLLSFIARLTSNSTDELDKANRRTRTVAGIPGIRTRSGAAQ